MEIKTTVAISYLTQKDAKKRWVALDDDVKEALSLYLHLRRHTEVQEAPDYKGMPICKICNKSAYQIMCEEWKSLSTSKKEGTELTLSGSPDGSPKPCPRCDGKGEIELDQECFSGRTCPECEGTGKASDS